MIEKKNKRQFFSLLLILISSISCNKNNVLQKSKKELLTQKTWKLIDNRQKLPNGSWSSVFPFMDSCRINDIYNYSPNFIYSVDEGVSKCNANDSQTVVSGSWSFQNNERVNRSRLFIKKYRIEIQFKIQIDSVYSTIPLQINTSVLP